MAYFNTTLSYEWHESYILWSKYLEKFTLYIVSPRWEIQWSFNKLDGTEAAGAERKNQIGFSTFN